MRSLNAELMESIDNLCGPWCRENPGVPMFAYYNDMGGSMSLQATEHLDYASDFSLEFPFYVVWYDAPFKVMRLRICL